jgi:hydrogenase nickel incorporation protein HypB
MGRFHRHDDGTVHAHDHEHDGHGHDHGGHSGYVTGTERITVLERIFSENDAAAEANRRALDAAGVVCLNLMSSPGAGKTALLERTLEHLQGPPPATTSG